ncbi:MAG: reverse transcriptase [Hyphomicrobiales bacterium]|nr:MAG: reverse transcriptase [Hyphomicrobiales bacterium]
MLVQLSPHPSKNIRALTSIYSERLLTPAGTSGFRITTKIHPFWNLYLNGLAVGIAENLEPDRSERAHSYRFNDDEKLFFKKEASWRSYKEATIADVNLQIDGSVVVQTDISNFYEHIYHHRIENLLADIFGQDSTVAVQINGILNKLSSGRSFGLPVGGQCARVLAEVIATSIDRQITEDGLIWHRYVDDYTLIAESQAEAYKALSTLSHKLADYGLSLNKSKTIILNGLHYENYVKTQLDSSSDDASRLREIDLHFDPYSGTAETDYEELVEAVDHLDIEKLLGTELNKSQPDAFNVTQIGRTLKLHEPLKALKLCETLLEASNLNSFRASWSSIMRGIAAVRADETKKEIFADLDTLIDKILEHSEHLLLPETNCLYFLKIIRFKQTEARARFVNMKVFVKNSVTLNRACIDCWMEWENRGKFNEVRNNWETLHVEVKRMLWLASKKFGDEGRHFRQGSKMPFKESLKLGIENTEGAEEASFGGLFMEWVNK